MNNLQYICFKIVQVSIIYTYKNKGSVLEIYKQLRCTRVPKIHLHQWSYKNIDTGFVQYINIEMDNIPIYLVQIWL